MIINNGPFGFQRNINQANLRLEKAMGKLSSGKRITSAAVDASGLAISEKLRALQRGSQQAILNVQNAQSLVQTADAAMQDLTDVVQRIRELTIQAMNGTNTDLSSGDSADTLIIQNEIDELKKNLGDIVHNTEFNTKKILTNTNPGEYVTADRSISVNRAAQTVESSAAALTGMNTVRTEPTDYVNSAKVVSALREVNVVPSTSSPLSGKATTVRDYNPRWSADGQTIVFDSTRDNGRYSVPADNNSNPIEDSSTATAATRKEMGDYRLTVDLYDRLVLQERSGNGWSTKASYDNLSLSDRNGYSFAPVTDQNGNLSFAYSNSDGNISKVTINTTDNTVGPSISVIPNTDKLNLPPVNNTVSLNGTPDLYRMNEANPSLIVHKVTDSGSHQLTYWDGTGKEPDTGYYTVNEGNVTFHKDAIIGFDSNSEDDAQDYYTFGYIRGNSSSFHTETIPSSAQLYNMHGEQGPMSLRIEIGSKTVAREQYLSERPADHGVTGVYIDKLSGKAEFYGDLRPAYNETVRINYVPDNDQDRTVQTYVLPEKIDTYNLQSHDTGLPKSLEVYVGSRKISYDETGTNGYTYDPATRQISIYGDSRPDVLSGKKLRFEYIADTSQTSNEVYGISLGTTKPEIFNLGETGAPNSIRVFRGNEEIMYSATDGFQYNAETNTIELFGNSRPNVGDEFTVRMVAVQEDPKKHDNKLEIKLNGRPELYDPANADYPSTLQVKIGGRVIAYDETKQDGFYYNKETNSIEVYGNSRPDANDLQLVNPEVSVKFVTESETVNLYNNSYDIRLAPGASSYGIEGDGNVKGLKVFKNVSEEIPYDAENGYTYDPDTKLISLHGTYRPTKDDAAADIRVYAVPEAALSRTVPAGSTVHKVTVSGREIPPAEDENGNGYLVEGGTVRLVGDGRPDVTFGTPSYKMEVLYTEPLSLDLPVHPLLTGDHSYCDHETGTALPDAEIVPDSQVIRLNGQILSRDQYEINGGHITLINEAVDLSAGNHTLSAEYQIRQGIHYKDNSYTFQVGGNAGNHKVLDIASFDNMLVDMSAVCVRTADHAAQGLEIIDKSMNFILGELGNIGAAENSLEHITANLKIGEESLTSALSRIEDVDMAKELMNSTKQQMLLQVGQTLAGHEKQRAESVLSLLK